MERKEYKRGYWPKERCLEEARKYMTRKDFSKGAPGAYKAACQQGWLNEVCSHMERLLRPQGYWTKEICYKEAQKYSAKSEFAKNCRGAYIKACREGWLDDICTHMISPTKPNGYWSKERCIQEARKYTSRTEFHDACQSAYNAAYTHGWLDDIYAHMEVKLHKFTEEECLQEALKYKRRTDFMEGSPHHYSWAIRHRFLKKICSHMERQGNLHLRKIYVFEFSDHHAYVGLAQYPKSREKQHLKEERSAVFKYIQETGSSYTFKELTDYLTKEEAAVQEDFWINRYAESGWIMINKKPGGDLGYGPQKYTKELCAEEALKYQYRKDFKKNNSILYNYASRHGWLEDICHHMKRIATPSNYWTKEKCSEIALRYSSRKEFERKEPGAYDAAHKHGWMIEICAHMPKRITPEPYWNKERCSIEALKYSTKGDFRKTVPSAYNSARKHGWLEDICSHMQAKRKPTGYWTKEECIEEATRNKSLAQFRKNCASAYAIAWRNGWIDEIRDLFK